MKQSFILGIAHQKELQQTHVIRWLQMIKLYESFKKHEIGQCVVILYHFFDIAKLPKNLPEMVKLAKMA